MRKFFFLVLIAIGAGLLVSRHISRDVDSRTDAMGPEPVREAASRAGEEPVKESAPEAQVAETAADMPEERQLPALHAHVEPIAETHPDPKDVSLPAEAVSFILPGKEITAACKNTFNRARELAESGELEAARSLLTAVYLAGDGDMRERSRRLLDEINEKLVFDPACLQGAGVHTVKSGETLSGIASRYGVNWRMVQRINRISRPELIRVNQKIKIIKGRPKILVEKSRFALTLFIDGYYVKEYAVGLGRENRTPTGIFTVDSMLVEADWYPPGGGVIKYGEEGHLIGTRWIGFEDRPGAAGYGIHGTNDPDSIGAMESEGCIRMHNEDVQELYDFLMPGAGVKVID